MGLNWLNRLHHRWFMWRNFYRAQRSWLVPILLICALLNLGADALYWWADTHPQCSSVAIRTPSGALVNVGGRYYAARKGTVTVRFCGQHLTETRSLP